MLTFFHSTTIILIWNLRGIHWENDKVRFLGVTIGEKIDELNEENFHDIAQKMMQSPHFWKGKYLSRKTLP